MTEGHDRDRVRDASGAAALDERVRALRSEIERHNEEEAQKAAAMEFGAKPPSPFTSPDDSSQQNDGGLTADDSAGD